jgi:hypothetical protein
MTALLPCAIIADSSSTYSLSKASADTDLPSWITLISDSEILTIIAPEYGLVNEYTFGINFVTFGSDNIYNVTITVVE